MNLIQSVRCHRNPEPAAHSRALACMSDEKIYDEPSEVRADDGVVKVKGPDAVDVQLTPEAADETSDRLLYGALKAQGQRVSKKARRGAERDAATSDQG